MDAPFIDSLALRAEERWGRVLEFGLPLLVWLVTTFALFAWGRHHQFHSQPWTAFVLVAASSWSLAFRHSHPRAMIACVALAALLRGAIPGMPQVTSLPLAIGLISFATRRPFREALAAALTAFCALLLSDLIAGSDLALTGVASRLLFSVGLTALGLFIGARRAYADQLRARARDLERERELLAERAVDEERVRIARELHDAIAHHVSLLVVQAGAIRESLPTDSPAHALADSMAGTGRQALDEMRSMLGVLRTSGHGNGGERAPQPGISDIGALVDQTRMAEVDVDLVVEGAERPVPVGIGLSAYRIVQESLTNVVKHAGPASARVIVRYLPDTLELEITDDGRGSPDGSDNGQPGHGIVGMRERVGLYGGELYAGPGPGHGWRVRAVLPLEPQR
jgi:signal transduction histidine kinase